jgi:hypothetical protein
MSAPAGIVMAKMLLPETEPEKIDTNLKVNKEELGVNLIDAMAVGASDGLKLALNIAGMLLAFIAVIAMLNYFLTDMVGEWTGLNAWVQQTTAIRSGAFRWSTFWGRDSGCWPGSSGWSGRIACRWAACWARRR